MAKEFTLTSTQFGTLNYILGHLQGTVMGIDGRSTIDIAKLKITLERLCNEKLEPIVMALRDQLKNSEERKKDETL